MDSYYEGFLYAANNDVKAIEGLYSLGIDEHCEVIAFHAQQAAEKMIKNVFVANNEMPPKTHAVDELLEYAIDKKWLNKDAHTLNENASSLTQYSVMARYAETSSITSAEALKAILDCNHIAKMLLNNNYEAVMIDIEYPN